MRNTLSVIFALAGTLSTVSYAADREIKVTDRLDASADTLSDMMKASDKGIPQDLLDKAKCVVVIPGMKRPDSSSAQSTVRDLRLAAAAVARAGALPPRCAWKAEA